MDDTYAFCEDILEVHTIIFAIRKASKDLVKKLTHHKQNVEQKIKDLSAQHEEEILENKKIIEGLKNQIEVLENNNRSLRAEMSDMHEDIRELREAITLADTDYASLCLRQLLTHIMGIIYKKLSPNWFDPRCTYDQDTIYEYLEDAFESGHISQSEYDKKTNDFQRMLDHNRLETSTS